MPLINLKPTFYTQFYIASLKNWHLFIHCTPPLAPTKLYYFMWLPFLQYFLC